MDSGTCAREWVLRAGSTGRTVAADLSTPVVSIVIPCRNEERHLVECLQSAVQQDYPQILEILCVDGGSTDRSRELVLQMAATDPRIRLVENPYRVVPHAMNIGIEASGGEIIVRLDAHSVFPSEYVRRCVAGLRETNAWNYGGVVVNRVRTNTTVARAIAALTNHPFGVGNSYFRHARQRREVDTVPFGCFPRWVFESIGLFDERLVRNQDNEFNARIQRAGGTIVLDPGIQIGYFNQETLKGLLWQAWWTGSWNAITHFLCPYTFRWRHALPGLFAVGVAAVGGVALALAIGLGGGFAALALALLLPYLAAATWAGMGTARRFGRTIGALVPVIGFLYHFVYGWGYVWGWLLVVSGKYRGRIPAPRERTK